MTDIHESKVRSYNMSKIKSKNTKPEMLVRRFLYSSGLRYRIHQNHLAGSPDLVLNKFKTLIFVNGCFWHGHSNCKRAALPKTRTEWWRNKISKNIQRDQKARLDLSKLGWKIFTVWECGLSVKKRKETLTNLLINIKKQYI